jgi:hypothetical protein
MPPAFKHTAARAAWQETNNIGQGETPSDILIASKLDGCFQHLLV